MARKEKILFLDHHGFGNVILSLPVLAALDKWAEDKGRKAVVLLNSPLHHALILDEGFEHLKFIYLSEKSVPRKWIKMLAHMWRPDLIIAAPNVPVSTLDRLSVLIRPKKILAEGYGDLPMDLKRHVLDVQQELLDRAGIEEVIPVPRLSFAREDTGKMERIGMHPFTENGKQSKQWPIEQFHQLARAVEAKEIHLFGGPEDLDTMQILKAGWKDMNLIIPEDFRMDSSLKRMAECDLFISGDTGPAHMAAALNVPVFAIFGPTDPDRIGPNYSRYRFIVPPTDCHPCYVDSWTDCDCIHKIETAKAVEELKDFLREIAQ